jgi:hypothetical protein
MKRIIMATMALIILAGCSKSKQYTQDLTGTWTIYKLTYNSNDASTFLTDSMGSYMITFTSGGQYTEQYLYGADSVNHAGAWRFQDSYGQLVLTDSTSIDTFTIFNLTGSSVELLRNSYDRYMRKNQ